ncbi:hypothetical protein J6TS2_33080 [Heyndrickxia sporothermodurans]|nr:hypothetical protein J6TS2_33080 [Heyndrickxia sporothermodurans]
MINILYKIGYILLFVYLVSLLFYRLKKKNTKSMSENVVLGWVIVFCVITIFIVIMTILK